MSPVVAELIAAGAGDTADVGEADRVGEFEAVTTVDDSVVEYRYEMPEHDVLVQLLGEVTVRGCDIQSADQVELLALLVCMRDRRPSSVQGRNRSRANARPTRSATPPSQADIPRR